MILTVKYRVAFSETVASPAEHGIRKISRDVLHLPACGKFDNS